MDSKVKKDETVVLIEDTLRKYFVNTGGKTDKIKGIGVFDPKILVGKQYGKQITIGDKQFWILQPSLMDKLQGLKRKAQIILPRDAGHIIMNCSIETGHKVLEAGIGSGSLTIALANTVAPSGKVFSYDNRTDFIDHALKNLKKANLDGFVTTKNKDITNAFKKSTEFRGFIEWVKKEQIDNHARHRTNIQKFCVDEKVAYDTEGLIELLQKVRGNLHHYTSRSSKHLGTPFIHGDFESIAFLTMGIAVKAILQKILEINQSSGIVENVN